MKISIRISFVLEFQIGKMMKFEEFEDIPHILNGMISEKFCNWKLIHSTNLRINWQ